MANQSECTSSFSAKIQNHDGLFAETPLITTSPKKLISTFSALNVVWSIIQKTDSFNTVYLPKRCIDSARDEANQCKLANKSGFAP